MSEMPDETKVCPECAETVKAQALVCRFCGYRFDGATPATPAPPTATPVGPAVTITSTGGLGRRGGFLIWALASALFMAMGAFGPWIGALGMSVSGTDGSNDGWIVVAAAVIGALLVVATRNNRGAGLWALLGGLIAALVTIYDRSHASHKIAQQSDLLREIVHIGWGLNLAMIASISFGLCGLLWLMVVDSAPSVGETATG